MTEKNKVRLGGPVTIEKNGLGTLVTITSYLLPITKDERLAFDYVEVEAVVQIIPAGPIPGDQPSGSVHSLITKAPNPRSGDGGNGVTTYILRFVARSLDFVVADALRAAGALSPDVESERAFRLRRGESDWPARREMSQEHLERVAKVYQTADAQGKKALNAVRNSFPNSKGDGSISNSTAARWIAEARKAGLLEERGQK
jgi:hypothetical protein